MFRKRLFLLTIACLLVALVPVGAGAEGTTSLTGYALSFLGQTGGISRAVTYDGTYAYLNVGPRVLILDVSDPAHPTVVGDTGVLAGVPLHMAKVGHYLYVGFPGDGLAIMDVATPSAPRMVTTLWPGEYIWRVKVYGNRAYVVGLRHFHILDLGNPASPAKVGEYQDASLDLRDVAVVGRTAFVTARSHGLVALDISDPANIRKIGAYDTPGDASSVAVSSHYAYVADVGGGLRVLDISDPAHMTEVGALTHIGYPAHVIVAGAYAYMDIQGSRVGVIDISDPTHPQKVASLRVGNIDDLFLHDSTLYAALLYKGMAVVDVTDPQHPALAGTYDAKTSFLLDTAVSGSKVLGTAAYQGLFTYDISSPDAPQQAAFVPLGYDMPGITLAGNYAYVAAMTHGMLTFDIQDPEHLRQVGHLDTVGMTWDIAVRDHYAYLADGNNGLVIADVTDPTAPRQVARLDMGCKAHGVALEGSYAYVACMSGGLRIVDVSDPLHPSEVGEYRQGAVAFRFVAAANHVAYVTTNWGFYIVDVSDPAHPQRLGYFNSGSTQRVTLHGPLAFLASLGEGVYVVDVSDPAHPRQVAYYNTPGQARHAILTGDVVVVADGWGGLLTLKFTQTGYRAYLPVMKSNE